MRAHKTATVLAAAVFTWIVLLVGLLAVAAVVEFNRPCRKGLVVCEAKR